MEEGLTRVSPEIAERSIIVRTVSQMRTASQRNLSPMRQSLETAEHTEAETHFTDCSDIKKKIQHIYDLIRSPNTSSDKLPRTAITIAQITNSHIVDKFHVTLLENINLRLQHSGNVSANDLQNFFDAVDGIVFRASPQVLNLAVETLENISRCSLTIPFLDKRLSLEEQCSELMEQIRIERQMEQLPFANPNEAIEVIPYKAEESEDEGERLLETQRSQIAETEVSGAGEVGIEEGTKILTTEGESDVEEETDQVERFNEQAERSNEEYFIPLDSRTIQPLVSSIQVDPRTTQSSVPSIPLDSHTTSSAIDAIAEAALPPVEGSHTFDKRQSIKQNNRCSGCVIL